MLIGEIPAPTFINQIIIGLADKNNQLLLYGKIKDKKFKYKNPYISLRNTKKKKIYRIIYVIALIIKLIYKNRKLTYKLLIEIWKNNKRINKFINRCNLILPPFVEELT